jgi:hypothetical protein
MPTSLVRRLRQWRAAVAGPEPDERLLARLDAWFPGGWPRRRALQALFAAGRPRQGREALRLAADLPDSSRRWCLPVLERSREWTGAERAELDRLTGGPSAPPAA